MKTLKFKEGDLVMVKPDKSWEANQSSANEAAWVSSKGGNPYGIWKITKILKNYGSSKEDYTVLQMTTSPLGGWHVPISRLEKA